LSFNQNQELAFGAYVDKILGYANQTFTGMYRKIYKQYWHDNKFFSKMNQCYCTTDQENATYETYMPTADVVGGGLSYYRIVLKLVPEVDNQKFRQEVEKLRTPLRQVPGTIDSELIIVLSPKLSKWGFIRAFRHVKKPGYLSSIFITKTRDKKTGKSFLIPPQVMWTKLVRFIAEFLNKRILAWLDALKLQPYQWDHKASNMLYYICNNSAILTRFSHSIRTSIVSLSHSLDHLLQKIKEIKREIGLENAAKQAIKPFLGLEVEQWGAVWNHIRTNLDLELKHRKSRLRPEEERLLQIRLGGS
jgi:hypothetical protein